MRDHVDTIAPISAAGPAPGSKYDRLIARAKEARPAITMVAHPCDESSLRGATEAAELGIIKP
ncbi:MAG TPA: phosphate acetyltransferase, partial [Pseudolabrys sp.]|nr:phosphate acetyltransferase [Pseudolabrys sp.]